MGKEIQVREQIIRGRPDEVKAALRASYRMGRLVTRPHNLPYHELPDGQIAVKVHMRTEVNVRWRDQNPVAAQILAALAWAMGIGLVVIGLVTGAIALIAHAVSGTMLAGYAALTVVVLLMLGWNRGNHSGLCPGLHCSGCKGH